jgi:nitrate reductase NapAB chaperone NapD
VVAEDTGDGHDRNHQTANLQGQLNAVLVVHNVDAEFPVVLVVIAEQTH